MKVRAKIDLKKGQEITVHDSTDIWAVGNVFEEVKEESLEDKLDNYTRSCTKLAPNMEDIAQIAKEHYLEVFDETSNNMLDNTKLRKALEDC